MLRDEPVKPFKNLILFYGRIKSKREVFCIGNGLGLGGIPIPLEYLEILLLDSGTDPEIRGLIKNIPRRTQLIRWGYYNIIF
jgi:hypothetical protein